MYGTLGSLPRRENTNKATSPAATVRMYAKHSDFEVSFDVLMSRMSKRLS